MPGKITLSELPEFDPAEHLKDSEDIAAYLSAVMEEGDSAELVHALGVVARSRGMAEIARRTGLAREALYRALRAGASPRFDTILRVFHALGLELRLVPRDQGPSKDARPLHG